MAQIYDFSANRLGEESQDLSDYRGKALLVVNTASKCGFTPQYEGLEALYKKYRDRGLEILGFPCNQFMKQEPGDAEEIASFCQTTYGVSFPMFARIDVKGPMAHPLYQYLTAAVPGVLGTKSIKWNFTKFLVSPEGVVVKRYAPSTTPEKIEADIEMALPG
ncbi:MAG: glutathione peroxidase [Immundisolibacteraceae bacterium]|nr:glutathione peroxidase [Immundisolibacteraceae bacterium]